MNLNTHTESKNLFLKTYILFWCILFSSFVNGQNKNIVETSMKELLTELDIRLDKTADYESQNIQKIKAAQKQLQEANNPKDKLLPARILVEEFLFYQSDSSLYYADLAVSIAEIGDKKFKVSFRTANEINAAACAKCFGGGGHIRAAGCRVYGYFEDVYRKILDVCVEMIKYD